MKIAIIFSGFFRTFEYCKQSLDDFILKPLNCDVFFTTPKTIYALPQDEIPDWRHIHSQNTNLVDDKIYNFFGSRLKKSSIRKYDSQFFIKKIKDNEIVDRNEFNQPTWRILSQMYAVSQSISLFKEYVQNNKIKYDFVILARPDVKYFTQLDLSACDWDKINFPNLSLIDGNPVPVGHIPPSRSLSKPFNDQLLCGTQDNMLIYHNIYDKVIEYHKNEDVCFNPETLFGYHCLKNNVDFAGANCVLYALWRYEKHN